MPDDDRMIRMTRKRSGQYQFLALGTLAEAYGYGGTDAVRKSLGFSKYKSGAPRLSKAAAAKLGQVAENIQINVESIPLEDLSGIADDTIHITEKAETIISNDQQVSEWAPQTKRELAGLEKAMTGVRDELANNLELSEVENDITEVVEEDIARQQRNLSEEENDWEKQEVHERMNKLERRLSELGVRDVRLEALSANKAAHRSQCNRIRERIQRLLHEDRTLAEHIRTLFENRESPSRRFSRQSGWQSRH